jgi:hypothetical protein
MGEQTDGKKSKRPDRAEKLAARKGLSETVVKTSLFGKLQGDKDFKKKALDAIEERVINCSKRVQNASVALNLMIKERFEGQNDLKSVVVPEFWDQTIVRQLVLGVQDSTKPNPHVVDFFQRYPDFVLELPRHLGDRNIYTFAAKKYLVNAKNHLVINFQSVLKKYLYNLSGLEKEDAIQALKLINGWCLADPDKDKETVKEVVRIVKEDVLGIDLDAQIGKLWFKGDANLPAMLRLFVFVSRLIDIKQESDKNSKDKDKDKDKDKKTKEVKAFNLLPISRIKPQFITMDSHCLYGLLNELGAIKHDCNEATFLELSMEHWNAFLDTSSVKGKNKSFTRTIDTDGVSINMHFTRPKNTMDKVADAKDVVNLKGKRVLGIDPGRSNILTVVEELEDGKTKSYRLTRSQYYREAGMVRAGIKTKEWQLGLVPLIQELSEASPKGASLEKFNVYLASWNKNKDALWEEYTKKRWREQRLRLYGGKKRVFSKFLNRLESKEEGVETILAFGSAKFAPGGKGEVSVPTTRSFKECSYRFPTLSIDEFRTSRISYKNDQLLRSVGKLNDEGKVVTVRGLLWCQSTNENVGKFVNRDLNAALNIRRCAMLPKRPPILDRKLAKEPLPQQTIGKMV